MDRRKKIEKVAVPLKFRSWLFCLARRMVWVFLRQNFLCPACHVHLKECYFCHLNCWPTFHWALCRSWKCLKCGWACQWGRARWHCTFATVQSLGLFCTWRKKIRKNQQLTLQPKSYSVRLRRLEEQIGKSFAHVRRKTLGVQIDAGLVLFFVNGVVGAVLADERVYHIESGQLVIGGTLCCQRQWFKENERQKKKLQFWWSFPRSRPHVCSVCATWGLRAQFCSLFLWKLAASSSALSLALGKIRLPVAFCSGCWTK